MLNDKAKRVIKECYVDSADETERKEAIVELAELLESSQMEVRQFLQDEGIYMKKEGKTDKQQYATALWAITGISEKEWMKLTYKSQIALMGIFKASNHESTEHADV